MLTRPNAPLQDCSVTRIVARMALGYLSPARFALKFTVKSVA
ncbi:hypothetical protein ABIE27_002922 [Paenibacillus sp. 4624]|nr:hypothetical protein [Paenibacillus amylolyticus]